MWWNKQTNHWLRFWYILYTFIFIINFIHVLQKTRTELLHLLRVWVNSVICCYVWLKLQRAAAEGPTSQMWPQSCSFETFGFTWLLKDSRLRSPFWIFSFSHTISPNFSSVFELRTNFFIIFTVCKETEVNLNLIASLFVYLHPPACL